MAQWRKVIVSGSNAELNNINSSGNVVPTITDGGSLGTSALNWSDLFLDSGAVVNFDGGDVTLTHSGNLLNINGGNTRVDRLELDSASDYLDVDTDLKIVAAADIILDPAGNNVLPGSDGVDDLGKSDQEWKDLYIDGVAYIDTLNADALGANLDHANFNSTNVDIDSGAIDGTAIGAASHTTIKGTTIDATTDFTIDGLVITADTITNDAGLSIIASAGDITLDPAGNNVLPGSNNADALGASGTSWSDLFLGSGAVVNFDAGDVTLTHAANKLTLGGGNLEVGDNNVSGSSVSTGSFGYLNIAGDGVFGGNLTFGDAATDSVSFGADIDSNLIPNVDDTYDLGSASQAWQDLFLEGDITLTDAGTLQTSAGVLTIDGAGGLTLDSDGTDAVNLGTEAVAKTITIGNAASTKVDINALALDFDSAAATDILAATTLSAKGATGASFGDDTGTWEFSGGGALSETGMTTISMTPSSTFDIDAGGAVTIDGSSITIGGDSDVAIDIDSAALDIDASGAVTIDSSGAAITIGGNPVGQKVSVGADTANRTEVELNAILVDINAGSGGVTIDGGAASNLTTSAGAVTIDGAGGVNIAGNSAEVDITTSGAVDINSGAFTLNGSTVGIDGSGALTLGASEMDIDADGGVINMDATSTITIGGTNATGVTIGKSDTTVTIPGSLDVNGTLTTIDTTNLKVADRFILMASGSSAGDGGIVVETNGAGSGTALGYDDSASRWALSKQDDTSHSSTTITPRQYVVSVSGSAADASGNPSDFGSAAGDRIGMMHVNTSTGDIFIFS